MTSPSVVSKKVVDIRSPYTTKEKILFFRAEMDIMSSKDEEMVILEACSSLERVTIVALYQGCGVYFSLFCFHNGCFKSPQYYILLIGS